MAFASYDAKEVQVIVGGAPITGFADGTFVEIEYDEQQFNKVTGADGLTSRAKTNNYAGTVTITLQQTSNGNDVLAALWNADRLRNQGVVPVLVKDNSGRALFSSANAWVQQLPSAGFGKEVGDRAWVLDCAEIQAFLGGNQEI